MANKNFYLGNMNCFGRFPAIFRGKPSIFDGTLVGLSLAAIKAGLTEGESFEASFGGSWSAYRLVTGKHEDRTPTGQLADEIPGSKYMIRRGERIAA